MSNQFLIRTNIACCSMSCACQLYIVISIRLFKLLVMFVWLCRVKLWPLKIHTNFYQYLFECISMYIHNIYHEVIAHQLTDTWRHNPSSYSLLFIVTHIVIGFLRCSLNNKLFVSRQQTTWRKMNIIMCDTTCLHTRGFRSHLAYQSAWEAICCHLASRLVRKNN